ncbi:hypothetical protein ABZX77_05700 [Streptomyces sp. NPDC004237]|uniref:hypothetical protein n=1 Tax=Streptomyces sp. NPDC004237 TaxID=3154455 RepID=UPI0033A676C1
MATEGSDWVPAVVAASICEQLASDDPELLDGWLRAIAVQALTEQITVRERSIRTATRARASARAFAAAAESGDVQKLRAFSVTFCVDEANTRRRVADMTGTDHRFVAADYAEKANTAKMLAAFHLAVAKKVGDRRTADVMSEPEYDRLYRSIVGTQPEGVAA